MDVEVKNSSAEAQQYTIQYEDTDGKLHVETFDLPVAGTKTFTKVKADTWKVIKVGPVSE